MKVDDLKKEVSGVRSRLDLFCVSLALLIFILWIWMMHIDSKVEDRKASQIKFYNIITQNKDFDLGDFDLSSLKTDEVQPGQVWRYVRYKDDPFKENEEILYLVLELHKGWVKFKRVTISGDLVGKDETMNAELFKYNFKLWGFHLDYDYLYLYQDNRGIIKLDGGE